ncbi:16S rRNA (adenine(1518)-N(6)/adenine(1519)-N(6))-dimethyltransferase RsmA [Millionella massiliensis]|uniref:16S rRNA (adenine(1518)-N(6)/adenine(1519)-N(6))- dimethyltransferase RsmA n=1 Tax=Millionella massiliensis TaxID=1871023 RepID=UPI0024B68AF9|nr:16S rRNA (adenine(1518)-N(6)/adenine(1519)-N(6))-dimethyltransferase RsmA [Millionella massiliensis]
MTEVRAKKYLGQHFLTDLNIARRIAEALRTDHAPGVLEVGPGMGVLTQFLLPLHGDRLTVAEIDTESVDYLRVHYPVLNIIEGDFLQLDLDALYAGQGGVNIIGNFPYNISSQIFFKVLDHRQIVPEVVGMIQKEVAVRLAAPPGGKEYGILSVLLQAYYDIEYLFSVPPGVFNPPPKVQSAVIRLTRNAVQHLDCDEALFRKIVKATFNQRRKTIRNSLCSAYPAVREAVSSGRLEPHPCFGLRPETLSVAQFVELTRWVADLLPASDSATLTE